MTGVHGERATTDAAIDCRGATQGTVVEAGASETLRRGDSQDEWGGAGEDRVDALGAEATLDVEGCGWTVGEALKAIPAIAMIIGEGRMRTADRGAGIGVMGATITATRWRG